MLQWYLHAFFFIYPITSWNDVGFFVMLLVTERQKYVKKKRSAYKMLQRYKKISWEFQIILSQNPDVEKHLLFVSLIFCWTYVWHLALSQGSDTFSTPGWTSQEAFTAFIPYKLWHRIKSSLDTFTPGWFSTRLKFAERKMDLQTKHCPRFLTSALWWAGLVCQS